MRVLRVLSLALALLLLTAAPAGADRAEPSSYESIILDGGSDLIEARIVGGDAFLEITADDAVLVTVPGYTLDDPEPYLRFLADGTVERNRNSPATYLNDDRFANVTIPESASPDATPDWEVVADNGSYTWHDHRIHWMGVEPPASVRSANERLVFQEWAVPLVVDGETVEITGELAWLPDRSPVAPLAVGLLGAVALLGVWWFRPGFTAVVPLVVGGLALAAGWAVAAIQPEEAGGLGPDVILPVAAVLAALVGLVFHRRRWPALVAAVMSGAVLAGWTVMRADALIRPVLPTESPALDRMATALAGGVGVGVVLVLVAMAAAPSLMASPKVQASDDPSGTQSLPQEPSAAPSEA